MLTEKCEMLNRSMFNQFQPMDLPDSDKVESKSIGDFIGIMPGIDPTISHHRNEKSARVGRLNLNQEDVKNGLGQLVLTLVKLLHELLERQAVRRIDSGVLSEAEIERLGVTFMKQAEVIEKLRKEFGLDEKDLNLDLGPLGKLL